MSVVNHMDFQRLFFFLLEQLVALLLPIFFFSRTIEIFGRTLEP